MLVLGEFRLKTLLDRITDEIRQITRESHFSQKQEYHLQNPLCEQQEVPPDDSNQDKN